VRKVLAGSRSRRKFQSGKEVKLLTADEKPNPHYRVVGSNNAEGLEKKLNEAHDAGYRAIAALDAPNQTSLVIMEHQGD